MTTYVEAKATPVLLGRRCFSVGLLAAAAWTLLRAGVVQAQFSVQPVIVELHAADTTQATTVQVTNEGARDLQFRFYFADFDQDVSGEHTFLRPGQHERSCGGRASVYPDGVLLKPGERQQITVRLQPGARTCWSLLFAEVQAPDGTVRINQRIGVKLYGIARGAERAGEIDGVRVGQSDSLRVEVDVVSSGEAPIRPGGKVELRAPDGRLISSSPVEPFSVLPRHRRTLQLALPRVAPGQYLLVPVLDFGGEYLMGAQVSVTVQ